MIRMTARVAVAIGSVWRTEDGDYCKVVAVSDPGTRKPLYAWVKPCTVNGHVRGNPSSVQTNLGWFEVWTEVER